MSKILWILNKYVGREKDEEFYPYFLKYTQQELETKGHQLSFALFSDLLSECKIVSNKFVYLENVVLILSVKELIAEAKRIEKEYEFTFKQAWFPDILQTSKNQNGRKINVPEDELNDMEPLVKKFLYLEKLIQSEQIDVIFSDASPEVEMEFGRAIGLKYNIPVLKAYEGSFLGRMVLLKHGKFGEDKLLEANVNTNYTFDDAEKFLNDYKHNKGQPSYVGVEKLRYKKSIAEKAIVKLKNEKHKIILIPFKFFYRMLFDLWLLFESSILKQTLYNRFEPDKPYLFFGFHLNQESTMGLRSLPYINQTVLVEILSRVLPYGYTLYVREHPHWPKRFPYIYLKKCNTYPNVRLLSPKISIHNILKNSSGVLVYNSNTGIEALIYGKPVLSFASNIYYKHHPAVLYCADIYETSKMLVQLINTKVGKKDTIKYLQKLHQVSIDFNIGSDLFLSEDDSKEKAIKFVQLMIKGINVATNSYYIKDVSKITSN